MANEQEKILTLLSTLRPLKTREFIRWGCSWDIRKNICRLKAKGHNIRNIAEPGHEAVYQLFPTQKRLF